MTRFMFGQNLLLKLCLLFAILAPLAACNTMEGAGEDVEDAGEAIQDGAD